MILIPIAAYNEPILNRRSLSVVRIELWHVMKTKARFLCWVQGSVSPMTEIEKIVSLLKGPSAENICRQCFSTGNSPSKIDMVPYTMAFLWTITNSCGLNMHVTYGSQQETSILNVRKTFLTRYWHQLNRHSKEFASFFARFSIHRIKSNKLCY